MAETAKARHSETKAKRDHTVELRSERRKRHRNELSDCERPYRSILMLAVLAMSPQRAML
jgi:hypothetical protein